MSERDFALLKQIQQCGTKQIHMNLPGINGSDNESLDPPKLIDPTNNCIPLDLNNTDWRF